MGTYTELIFGAKATQTHTVGYKAYTCVSASFLFAKKIRSIYN